MIVTTRPIYQALRKILAGLGQIMFDAKLKSINNGFDNILIDGVPVVVDDYCPSGHMFFLNKSVCYVIINKNKDFKMSEWMKPINQHTITSNLSVSLQLVSSAPRFLGKIIGITEPTLANI